MSDWLIPEGSRRRALAGRINSSVPGLAPRVSRLKVRRGHGDIPDHLEAWSADHPFATIVQIGSHNGRTGEPLVQLIDRCPSWNVLFVEPMPNHFAALTACRGGQDRFTLVQAAVTDHDGEVVMTTVDTNDAMPAWADQLTSLHREIVLRHSCSVPGLEDALREETVPAMTFATLIKSAHVESIDLLHIDAEGNDAAILDQVDLDRTSPEVILFEHKHLSTDDRQRCEARLEAAGYELRADQCDTLAIRPA